MMVRIFYNSTTGAIVGTVSSNDPTVLPTSGDYIDVPSFTGDITEWRVTGGVLAAASESDIFALRQPEALEEVRKESGRIRGIFVTDLPGQEMLYVRKENEAIDYAANLTGSHPLIEAEIGITGATKIDVANVYLQQAAIWETIAANLEAIRLSAIASIEAATTVAEIDTALATFAVSIQALEASLAS